MKAIAIVIVGFLAISTFAFFAKVVLFPAHVANKAADMSYGIVDKTLDPTNAIYNYEWFKKQYGEIVASERNVTNTVQSIEDYKAMTTSVLTFEDKQELARLNSVLNGQRNYVNSLKHEYDARAKMANRSIFKDIPASFGF